MCDGWITVKKKGCKILKPKPTDTIINNKKILCKNIITIGSCNYGNKCHFAHSIDDQKLDHVRLLAYNAIRFDTDLSNYNRHLHINFYETLLILTKICDNCILNKCSGGYNCKFGACRTEYQVCKSDLQFGRCINENCILIHLSKKGLPKMTELNIPIGHLLTYEYFSRDNSLEFDINMNSKMLSNGTSECDNISDIADDVRSVDSCDQSIFLL